MRRRFVGFLLCFFVLSLFGSYQAFASCASPANAIERENCLPGTPSSQWDITGAGDPTIQGFGTDISVNVGGTIFFKINTPATRYHFDIYRLGYYGGNGARLIAQNLLPSAHLPQAQPACLTDAATNLLDCGNWAVSASWQVPSTAVSGVYLAHLVRDDTGGDSHIVFIVRNDASHSDVLFQTADESWQAYNDYGGHSLYGPNGEFDISLRAFKVSYNRPFNTRNFENASWLFYAEFPMIKWLEANGYDVTYFSSVDAARNGSLITNHKLYVSTGHDEYASGPKRANIEAARAAGVNLAFFSGNEFFWKTRWENSIDGSSTSFRTMACYKETLANAVIDPQDPPTWTGTWRDPRFSPPADGGRPENSLTGQLFRVNGFGADNNALSIQIPAADGKMRFWRNTPVAGQSAGQVWTLAGGTLGYEWDVDEDNGSRPAGLVRLSSATYPLTTDYLLDFGGTYGAGTATHHMSLYRASSGALVFGAGTVQWAWGLDSDHDTLFYPGFPADPNMQQATLNLFADMGVQPATIQPGLVPAAKSTDITPPHSTITSPANGVSIPAGSTVTVSGTAADTGGLVGGVEVSADGGSTWHPANGRESWSFSWHPQFAGTVNLKSRAADDSGNIETPSAGISVLAAAHDCPCTIWSSSTVPGTVDSGDITSGEFGVRFFAEYDGYITGIRFYKASTNTGTHIGHLWSNTGTLLASATFTGETASGWQQVSFSNPVAVTANTMYVASFFSSTGRYSVDSGYFGSNGVDNSPLHATANGVSGANGVYSYGSSPVFPTSSFGAANYWADVVYLPGSSMPGAPASLLANPGILNFAAFLNQAPPASQNVSIYNQGTGTLNWTATKSASWITISATSGSTPATLSVSANPTGLAAGTYTGTITITPSGGATGPQTINVTLTLTAQLLSSNFDDGTMEGWAISPLGLASNWSVVSGALQYNGGGHTQVYAGDSSWTDYTLQADIKLATAVDYPGGIRGRVNPSTGAAYALWLYPSEGLIKLFKINAWNIDSGFTQLSQASVGLTAGSFHHVQMNFQGGQIQVFFDGNLAITATDAAPYPSGMIALDTSNKVITFDNILVTALQSTPNPLAPSATSLAFSGSFQAASPAPQTIQLNSTTAGALAYTAVSTASWLSVSLSNGTTPAPLQIAANTTGLAGGTYNGTIRVTSLAAPNSPQNINVTLTVIVPPPAIVLSPAAMSFQALSGQASPPAQTLQVLNGGNGSFNWTAGSDASWLTTSAASGATPASITVSANSTGLAAGVYTGHITVSATGIANSPQTLTVTLSVLTQDMADTFADLAQGWISTPLGNAGGWSVSNGVYSYNGGGLSLSCAGNTAWSDIDFDTNIKLSTLSNWPGGVRARVNPATGAGYAVWLYPGSGLAILYRVPQWNINDPALTALAVANLSYDTTAFHDLKMSFRGSQISVFWDGQALMSATDSTYASGFICMDADSQPISYSNVRVSSAQAAVSIDTPSPSALTFAALPGTQPAPQTLSITAGGKATTWSATTNVPWLTATASTNVTPGTITVSANTSGLAAGTYTGSVTIHAPGATNSPLVIPVTLGVKTAILATAPASLNFFGATGFTTPSQNISVTNAGSGALNWTASADASWITLSSITGAAPSSIAVTPNLTGLASGSYTGHVTISSGDAANGPAVITVSLQVGTQSFFDDFSSGLAANWTISPMGNDSGWSVVNGAYTFNGQGPSQSWAGNPAWTDYVMSADLTLSSLNNYPGGIRGRVNTSTGASYGVWLYPTTGLLRLWRITQWNIDTDPGLTLLGQPVAVPMDTNPHTIKLMFKGSQISVYYDNALVLQATDATYAQGAIALETHDKPISFDNISVITF